MESVDPHFFAKAARGRRVKHLSLDLFVTRNACPHGPALIAGNRKAAKRTFPFDLKIGETIQLALPRPQNVDIQARKNQRREEPFPTSTDEASTALTSHDTTTADLPPPDAAAAVTAADDSYDLAGSDPMMDYSIDPAAARTGKWTADEDKKLRDSPQAAAQPLGRK